MALSRERCESARTSYRPCSTPSNFLSRRSVKLFAKLCAFFFMNGPNFPNRARFSTRSALVRQASGRRRRPARDWSLRARPPADWLFRPPPELREREPMHHPPPCRCIAPRSPRRKQRLQLGKLPRIRLTLGSRRSKVGPPVKGIVRAEPIRSGGLRRPFCVCRML